MGVIDGFSAARMLEIEQASVVSGSVDSSGELRLETEGGTVINAGNVMPALSTLMPALRDFLYPVGHLYFSVNETSPETLFGGTWVSWGMGKVPVGVDLTQTEFNSVEKTGGEKTHLLTGAESGLKGHNHEQNPHNHEQNPHNHTQNPHNHTQTAHNHTQDSHNHGNTLSNATGASASHTHGLTTAVAAIYAGYWRARTALTAWTASNSGGVSAPGGDTGSKTGSAALFGNTDAPSATNTTTITNSATVSTNQAATAVNNAVVATNQVATAVNQATTAKNVAVADASATQAHNNLQPFVTCYMWKRTA